MKFESLPNELLLDLFEFLNGVQLLRAFRGLNSRFSDLVFTHFQSKTLDFRSISKTDFDIICQQHVPLIVDRITSLRFSDDEETPQLSAYFLSYNLALRQFTHLQSLSLSNIDSPSIMDKIIDDLCFLPHLKYLNVADCCFQATYIDKIWRLPKLAHCKFESINAVDWSVVPTVVSLSLQYLSILRSRCNGVSSKQLLEYTPRLQRLSLMDIEGFNNQQLSSIILSMEILELSLGEFTYCLENLEYMPNLCQLTLRIKNIYVNGYQWEKVITAHLPKLNIFRLMMSFELDDDINSEKKVEGMLDSFRTRFWIDEHQWFVQCHWVTLSCLKIFYLYTPPYTFPHFTPGSEKRFKSTCPRQDDFHSYDRVHSRFYDAHLFPDFFRLYFVNPQRFSVDIPTFEPNFWSIVPTFDRLTSLSASLFDNGATLSRLQTILDKAPHLISLKLYSTLISPVRVVKITSKSVRQLNFQHLLQRFNEHTCAALSSCPIGIHCEVLSIVVENRTDILHLVNNMKNLRVLSVNFDFSPSTKDEVIEWLKQHLPSTSTISSNKSDPAFITLWIR